MRESSGHSRWFFWGILLPVIIPGSLLVAGDLVFERKGWPAYFAAGQWLAIPALESWQNSPSLGLDQVEDHLGRWLTSVSASDAAPVLDPFAHQQLLRMEERAARIRWALAARSYVVVVLLAAIAGGAVLAAAYRRRAAHSASEVRRHALVGGALLAAFVVFYIVRFHHGVADAAHAWHLLDALPADLARFATPRLYGDDAHIQSLAHTSGLLRGAGWAAALLIALGMGATSLGCQGLESSRRTALYHRQDLLLYALSAVLITAVFAEFALRSWLTAPLAASYDVLAAMDGPRTALWAASSDALAGILHMDALYNAVEYCVCLALVYLPVRWVCARDGSPCQAHRGIDLKSWSKTWAPRLAGLLGPYLASVLQLLVQ